MELSTLNECPNFIKDSIKNIKNLHNKKYLNKKPNSIDDLHSKPGKRYKSDEHKPLENRMNNCNSNNEFYSDQLLNQ